GPGTDPAGCLVPLHRGRLPRQLFHSELVGARRTMAQPDCAACHQPDHGPAAGRHRNSISAQRAHGFEIGPPPGRSDALEAVAKLLVLHLCRKLCRSLSRKMPDPTKIATKAADKVFLLR